LDLNLIHADPGSKGGTVTNLQAKNQQGSKVPGGTADNVKLPSPPAEEKVIEPSSIQDKPDTSEVSCFEEPTSDIAPVIDAENFPNSTTDVEIIDKLVIEEELAMKNDIKTLSVESKTQFETDEDEVDEWPEDDAAEDVGTAINNHRTSVGREEDVSFSDLEDGNDDDNKRDRQQGK
jgi:hypothetical protein